MKFPGKCLVCNKKIEKDEIGFWAKDVGVKHEKCANIKPAKQDQIEIEYPNKYLKDFEVRESTLRVIEDFNKIEESENFLIDLFQQKSTKNGTIRIGLPMKDRRIGTTTEYDDLDVFWIPEGNFWWSYKKLESAKHPRYRNLFGINEPSWLKDDERHRNHPVVEVNPSLYGKDDVIGAFVSDDIGNVYLATKRVWGGFARGFNVTEIEKIFKNNSKSFQVNSSTGKRNLYLICNLKDANPISQISFFVNNVGILKSKFENISDRSSKIDGAVKELSVLDSLSEKGVNKIHIQVLKKFLVLKNQIIKDSSKIRGEKGVSKIPADNIVSEPHYLHNLVRGVYKPEGDDYAQSILTNPESKWGTEIDFEIGKWKINYDFGEGYKFSGDINALKKCYDENIPIGVIFRHKKGVNQILGLGKISNVIGTKFEITPYDIDEKREKVEEIAHDYAKEQFKNHDYSAQGSERTIFVRAKQQIFREHLLNEYEHKCTFCAFGIENYLNASHIVPYKIIRQEDEENAMHPSDGLLLCRLCDIAFEYGDIQVSAAYDILISDVLKAKSENDQTVKTWLSHIGNKLRIRNDPKYLPNPKYLAQKMNLIAEPKSM